MKSFLLLIGLLQGI